MARQTILVSGSGIAGPTVAYWLLKRGFTPVLIERAPHFRAVADWLMRRYVADRFVLPVFTTMRKEDL